MSTSVNGNTAIMEGDGDAPEPCPFCGFKAESDYQIMLHIETMHCEGDSLFVARNDATMASMMALNESGDPDEFYECPVDGCGEAVLLTEIDSHIDMHSAESDDVTEGSVSSKSHSLKRRRRESDAFDTNLPPQLRNLDRDDDTVEIPNSSDKQTVAKAAWKGILNMPEQSRPDTKKARRRLGKSELGPHAHERQMPSWLVDLIQKDGQIKTERRVNSKGRMEEYQNYTNHVPGIIPVVEQLLERDLMTSYAYLCDPNVRHVSKLKREGGFCGYRNIQMICSYIIDAKSQGYEQFNGKIPSIFEIQEYIEHAWDLGINVNGRVETGGIRGTRKYIGTPDAQAMLHSLNIANHAGAIKTKQSFADLFLQIEAYFTQGCNNYELKVRNTSLPPIYFQHPGHSMTIIGFEKKEDGNKNLLVFDPMFHDHNNMIKLVGQTIYSHRAPADLLRAYRRGQRYLSRYKEFEILKLTPPKAQKPASSKASAA